MSEVYSGGVSPYGRELVCASTDIPVRRVLGLCALLAQTYKKVPHLKLTDEEARRYGVSMHYETMPLVSRNPDDIFDNPDDDIDQSTHMTFQVKYPRSERSRLALTIHQYSLRPNHSPAVRQRYAFEWGAGDELAYGSRRDVVITPARDKGSEKPEFRPVIFTEDTLIFDEEEKIVQVRERALQLEDIDSLELNVMNYAERMKRIARRRMP